MKLRHWECILCGGGQSRQRWWGLAEGLGLYPGRQIMGSHPEGDKGIPSA